MENGPKSVKPVAPSHRPWLQLALWNAIANYSGRTWTILLNVALIPVYLRLLGAEAYGLIGVFVVLQGAIQLFDVGLSAALNRELARLPKDAGGKKDAAALVRSFELLYFGFGILVAVGVHAAAPVIAGRWLSAPQLSPAVIARSLTLMGLVIGISWPSGMYSGGLLGLERHVLLNSVQAALNTARYIGVVPVLLLSHGSVTVYFVWQLIVSAVQVTCLRWLLWRNIAAGEGTGGLSLRALQGRVRSMVGISGTYVAVVALTQMDKLLVSSFVTLDNFSYYMLAWGLMNAFHFVYYPLNATVFPRLSTLCGQGRATEAASLYCTASQITALGIFPGCAVLCFFAPELVSLWLPAGAVAKVSPLVSWLAPGAAFGAFMSLSNMFQWAHGESKAGFWTNLVALFLMAPAVVYGTIAKGLLGAAIAVCIVRIAQALAQFELAHRMFLREDRLRWYRSIATSASASAAAAMVCKAMLPGSLKSAATAAALLCVWITATSAAVAADRGLRRRVTGWIHAALGSGQQVSIAFPSAGWARNDAGSEARMENVE